MTTCRTATYDTRIAVHSGGCGTLTSLACNDDTTGCAGFTTVVDWMTVSGIGYLVRVVVGSSAWLLARSS